MVSAIGHDIDVSISDFVADLRSRRRRRLPELIAPDGDELEQVLLSQLHRLQLLLAARLREKRLSVKNLTLTFD